MGVIDIEAPSALLAVSEPISFCLPYRYPPPKPLSRLSGTSSARHAGDGRRLHQARCCRCRASCAARARWLFRALPPRSPGKEVSGVEHADVDLYTGKQVILTPMRALTVSSKWPLRMDGRWDVMELQMSPEAHDAAFAAVSHLPHLIAFALINAHPAQPAATTSALAGPGLSRFHPHRRQRSGNVARHPDGQPRGVAAQSQASSAALEALEP